MVTSKTPMGASIIMFSFLYHSGIFKFYFLQHLWISNPIRIFTWSASTLCRDSLHYGILWNFELLWKWILEAAWLVWYTRFWQTRPPRFDSSTRERNSQSIKVHSYFLLDAQHSTYSSGERERERERSHKFVPKILSWQPWRFDP